MEKQAVNYDLKELFDNLPSNPTIIVNVESLIRDDMVEIDRWLNISYYSKKNRLLGGAEDEEIFFSENVRSQCKQIINTGYSLKKQAAVLKDLLVHDSVIDSSISYCEFVENNKLMKSLKNCFISALSDDPDKSRFGCNIISDFELAMHLQGEASFNQKMKDLNILNNSAEFDSLRKNRSNIMRFITKVLYLTIDSFDLTGETIKEKNNRLKREKFTPENLLEQSKKEISELGAKRKLEVKAKENAKNTLTETIVMDVLPEKEFKFLGKRSFENKIFIDHYTTPNGFVDVLYEVILKPFPKEQVIIWEPCCGEKKIIVTNLRMKEYKVYCSDIIDNNETNEVRDFLKDEPIHEDINIIITNPPWSQNKKFLKRVVELKKSFAFLIKLDVLATKYFTSMVCNQDYTFKVVPIHLSTPFYNEEKKCKVQVGKVCWVVGMYKYQSNVKAEICFHINDTLHEVLESNDTNEDDEILITLASLFEPNELEE